MPIGRSNSLFHSKKPLPQINDAKQLERTPLATSPIVNSLKNSENIQNLSISDCSCPICLEILIEPVVLPCKHELCLPCFKDMMDQTNFLCPMCRMRLSTWARSASKHNALVDKERWNQLQRAFGKEIRNRIEGKTAILLTEEIKKQKENQTSNLNHQIVSAQGEIKKEYEDYVRREQERIQLEKEKEESLSLQYIQEIIQREEAISFNDYLRAIKTNQPEDVEQENVLIRPVETATIQQPTTSASSNQVEITTATIHHQPFITPSLPTSSHSAANRLLHRVKTIAVNTPTTSTDSTDSAITPSYSLRPRASMKRNIEQVKNIQSNLLNSLREHQTVNTSNVEDAQPKPKRVLRSKSVRQTNDISSESISDVSVDTSHGAETNIEIDSKQPVIASGLSRRKSIRTVKK